MSKKLKGWRLEGWVLEQPIAQALSKTKKDSWGWVRMLTPFERELFEAGADAMLEALNKEAENETI